MTALLEVSDLHARYGQTSVLHGLNLHADAGQVITVIGPNGAGKSTLSSVIMGKPGYEVTEGEILLDGESILEMEPDERAAKGVFLAFQYPLEIPGVATMTFLRTAVNAQRKARGEAELTTPDFMRPAGIVHVRSARSISDQRACRVSDVRVPVRIRNSNASLA